MRKGLIAVVLLAAALAIWASWPTQGVPRAARSENEEQAELRIVPSSPAPDFLERVAEGLAKLEERRATRAGGIVRGPDGEPLAGAEIRADDVPAGVTGDDGRFSYEWPKVAKSVHVRAIYHRYLDAEVEIEFGESAEITLEEGLAVSGRVRFPDGAPVPDWRVDAANMGASIHVERSWSTTDADGRFRIPGLREGQVAVSCRIGRAGQVTQFYAAGASDLEFELRDSLLRIDLRAPGGEPAHRAALELRWQGDPRLAAMTPDGESSFRIPNVERNPVVVTVRPGVEVTLSAAAPGCRPLTRTIRALSDAPSLHDERLEFEAAGIASVLLDVRKAGGARASEAVIALAGTIREETHAQVGTSPIRIDGLDPGPALLHIHAEGQPYLLREIAVVATGKPSEPARVDLPRGAALRVRWPKGQWLQLCPAGSGGFQYLWRNADDFMTTSDVPAGIYVLKGYRNRKVVREMEITLDAARENKLDWSDLE